MCFTEKFDEEFGIKKTVSDMKWNEVSKKFAFSFNFDGEMSSSKTCKVAV
jgi:hypothetical protein